MEIQKFWESFLKEAGLPLSTTYQEAFHFELTQALADHLLKLVLTNKKERLQAASMHMKYSRNEYRRSMTSVFLPTGQVLPSV